MRKNLLNVFEECKYFYGELNWWPADNPYEVVLGAILTQNTNWSNVTLSIMRLKKSGNISPEKIEVMDIEELKIFIKSSGFYNRKAVSIKRVTSFINRNLGGNIEDIAKLGIGIARRKLLELKGIGCETADSILLYAANMPIFVVDAYTIRFLGRMWACKKKGYNEVQKVLQDSFPHDINLYKEFHAQIVEHSKQICKKKPLCSNCFLKDACLRDV